MADAFRNFKRHAFAVGRRACTRVHVHTTTDRVQICKITR